MGGSAESKSQIDSLPGKTWSRPISLLHKPKATAGVCPESRGRVWKSKESVSAGGLAHLSYAVLTYAPAGTRERSRGETNKTIVSAELLSALGLLDTLVLGGQTLLAACKKVVCPSSPPTGPSSVPAFSVPSPKVYANRGNPIPLTSESLWVRSDPVLANKTLEEAGLRSLGAGETL